MESIAPSTIRSRYKRFRQELVEDPYEEGDVYDKETVEKSQREWAINTEKYPYLQHVKNVSRNWPHLRLLADFMEVTTTPSRWRNLKSSEATSVETDWRTKSDRERRASRTHVTQLQYLKSGYVKDETYMFSGDLTEALREIDDQYQLRLFVVEDLSRDVIETLGHELGIEPSFFRAHIVDYAWNNIRDRWLDPPNLYLASKRQSWFQLRFLTARYFKSSASFESGYKQSQDFNVLRRPDDDTNNKALFDASEAIVGITRARATFWSRNACLATKTGAVGVLLLDPTITEGCPLWHNYRNWENTPSESEPLPDQGPPRDTVFEDFIYWAKKPNVFNFLVSNHDSNNTHVPVQALLHLVCSQWLTMTDYIKTRLNQIEWEVSEPATFLHKDIKIDDALQKLHFWRRVVPLYREMLTETLSRVFRFPCHMYGASNAIVESVIINDSRRALTHMENSPIEPFAKDFRLVLSYLEEYQARIDRLTSVVTAIISIADSRRSQNDAKNVARLTWLATVFIPLSYITGLFSMTPDVSSLKDTAKVYVAVAVPLAILSLGLAYFLTMPNVQKAWSDGKKMIMPLNEKEKKT